MNNQRKGVVHVVEAIIAAFILFLFVLTATTLTDPGPQSQTEAIHSQTFNVLHALDVNGSLREPLLADDLTTVRSLVADQIPARNVEIAFYAVNRTDDEVSFTTQYSTTFNVSTDREQEIGRFWFRDATAANVSINGQYVVNQTGKLTDTYRRVDITNTVSPGSNTLRFDVVGSAVIGYSIDRFTADRTGEAPTGTNVFTTTYLISGTNTSFSPAEVTVLSWY